MELLVIRPGALGDTLMVLPALAELKGRSTVCFAGREPGLSYIREAVSKTMDLERAGWHRLFSDQPLESSPLPVSRADIISAFFKDPDGVIKKNLKRFFPSARVSVFPAFPPKTEGIHVARYLAECLVSAGLPVNSGAAMDKAGKGPLISGPWASKSRRRVVFHPGSGDSRKNFPPDLWRRIFHTCMEMDRLAHFKPTLLLGPAETPLKPFFKDCDKLPKQLEIFFCPEREQLLQILGSAALYLGHDSGITHLAGLMGTPTVALFKASDPVQWAPLGPHVRIIHGQKADQKLLHLIATSVRGMVSTDG